MGKNPVAPITVHAQLHKIPANIPTTRCLTDLCKVHRVLIQSLGCSDFCGSCSWGSAIPVPALLRGQCKNAQAMGEITRFKLGINQYDGAGQEQ
jgi:hypothetical protein